MGANLRPLSTGQLLDRTFQIYRQQFVLFAGISAIPHVTLLIAQLATLRFLHSAPRGSGDPVGLVVIGASGAILLAAISLVLNSIATAATTFGVSDIYLEKPTSISACFARVNGQIWRVIVTSLELGLRIALGFILLIIPGFYFAGKYGLAVPAVVLENIPRRDACRRSGELTKDSIGRIILIYFLTWILIVIVAGGLGAVLAMVMPGLSRSAGTVTSTAVQDILSTAVNILITPVMAIALTLAYYDQRVRKEAFDIENMMQLLGSPDAPVPQNSVEASS